LHLIKRKSFEKNKKKNREALVALMLCLLQERAAAVSSDGTSQYQSCGEPAGGQ
jgi:hypothetical protein